MKEGFFLATHVQPMDELIVKWKGLFTRFVVNEDIELQLISVLEDICIELPEIGESFHVIVQILNKEENLIVKDDSIKSWAVLDESKYKTSEEEIIIPNEYHRKFVEKMRKYIEQI